MKQAIAATEDPAYRDYNQCWTSRYLNNRRHEQWDQYKSQGYWHWDNQRQEYTWHYEEWEMNQPSRTGAM